MQEFFNDKNEEFIQWLNCQWNIEFECVRGDIDIQGSPERTLSRAVLQDKDGTLFLLEKFSKNKFQIRQNVAKAIEYLNDNGLKLALLYQKSNYGEFLPFFKDVCFQLSRFIDGTVLKRPDYLSSSKMGNSFALFLMGLSKASANIGNNISFEPFSIKKYIYKLFSEMKIYDNSAYKKYLPFLAFLEKEFMEIHDNLPVSFCHGDLHPLNIIWNHDQIRAVIDWEFAGMKPAIYDAANLVGCAGIENPDGLGMPMVMTFIKELRGKDIFSKMGWRFFPEYLLALRFAWLSEWLRKKDKQMLEMEEVYMGILVNNMDILRQGWQI
ncbi:MAG: aminoglycoside phosphotransferase family protein [Desulfobacula sp.]|uniref:aminoglycoside phosphotransferase family protein n=1 Tax=Desulfobacula sp. TaxID=2593537 RepID=UPI0025C204FB|nr:aminoglycoside phosphotransferase family protein [Desulfobacula sp.]MCD4718966.1 aminoglycoside phosphotransferase family protein [Desulfobacula sp.]